MVKNPIQSLTMIPIPAMKICENDPMAHRGFNGLWERSMTAVKSGKFEKHRKVLFI